MPIIKYKQYTLVLYDIAIYEEIRWFKNVYILTGVTSYFFVTFYKFTIYTLL